MSINRTRYDMAPGLRGSIASTLAIMKFATELHHDVGSE